MITAARANLYQTNICSEWFSRYLIRYLITTSPQAKEVRIPTAKLARVPLCSVESAPIIVNRPAPKMIGKANRNDNSAESLREIPSSLAAPIVIAERENPGTSAIACANPIKIALRIRNRLIPDVIS